MSEVKKNGYQMFVEETPQVATAFHALIREISTLEGLDDKTRQLIYIGICASRGDTGAVVAHVPMAKQAGASKEEIRSTILLTLTTTGVMGVTSCLLPAMEVYDV